MDVEAAGLAPYERVAESVRRAIRVGDWKPGQKLPSNRDLAKDHGVSLNTLQKAVGRLQDEGWLISRPTIGVFVAATLPQDTPPISLVEVQRQLADLRAAQEELQRRVEELERRP
ncbi:GntR family transcriptional regulator [Amycolatopsis sp. CA-161197]|uniref:GntR family transcriptional regulator n=1 Tax=unclassified Amycolatopsis TaxID=2618356 RepID=UPI003448D475